MADEGRAKTRFSVWALVRGGLSRSGDCPARSLACSPPNHGIEVTGLERLNTQSPSQRQDGDCALGWNTIKRFDSVVG
jgi:hypothetical protein